MRRGGLWGGVGKRRSRVLVLECECKITEVRNRSEFDAEIFFVCDIYLIHLCYFFY